MSSKVPLTERMVLHKVSNFQSYSSSQPFLSICNRHSHGIATVHIKDDVAKYMKSLQIFSSPSSVVQPPHKHESQDS